ncbi:MAG: malL [Herbinix sp.]|jgi:oligo-1,6-glucosidase|nr:malL [Herbinix sp.]
MKSKLNMNSKVKEVYQNPIGHDILRKLLVQLDKSETLLTNPIIGNLSLKRIAYFTKGMLDQGFFSTLLDLLNSETDYPNNYQGEIKRTWWKEAVIYQIYPRSFQDSDGDGIGDLKGIQSRLDYLKDLGVDALWLSPIYDSPNDDNGYDIRNYFDIMKEFGTMEDFQVLLNEVHHRGMKLIMDLVVNHTSDEHPWFQSARNDPDSKYKNFYHFKKSEGHPPNNWTSFFSGSAWNYYEEQKEWALHLFSKKQMDLNWENEEVRKEIREMIRWWLRRGVDGFRLDVINYISKQEGLPEGNESIGKLMGYYGIEHYFYGPKLHEYLKELKEAAFAPFDAFTVGETPGVGMEMSKLLTAQERKELDMVFSFDHLETPGHVRFEEYQYDLNFFKRTMIDYMEHYGSSCWLSLFYENHDNPRMISKINGDTAYRQVLGKLLAMMQLTLRGTPFLFQGQEIGAVNRQFSSIEEFRDVESINLFHELKETIGEEAALKKVISGSRDHARSPMQWSGEQGAGFSKGIPWSFMDADYQEWNVENQLCDNNSVLRFYQALIQIRKLHRPLIYGEFRVVNRNRKDLFTYYRKLDSEEFYVECNLSSHPKKISKIRKGYQLVLSNYETQSKLLRPYEANLYQKIN